MPITPIAEHNLRRLEYISIFFRELRLNAGLTQAELSRISNLHYNTILRAENIKNISLLTLFKLADTLEIDIKDIFYEMD